MRAKRKRIGVFALDERLRAAQRGRDHGRDGTRRAGPNCLCEALFPVDEGLKHYAYTNSDL